MKASGRPYVRVRIADTIAGVRRLRMTGLYAGAEADQPHGGGVCSDGSVIRARRTSGTTVQYQRIAVPSSGSAWSTWTSLATLGSGTYAQAAAAGVYAIIAVDDGNNVKVISSTDSGATWSALVTARAGGAVCAPVAVAIKSNGDAAAFWVESGVLYGAKRTAGTWGARVASALAFTSISGLGACYNGADWVLAITGVASSQARVWTARWGDGGAVTAGTWEAARVLVAQDTIATIAYAAPNISYVDTYRVSYSETFSGTGAYVLNLYTWAPLLVAWEQNIWREPLPLPSSYTNGVAIPGGNGFAYELAPALVRQATLPSLTGTDYSARVVAASWAEPGRCRVLIENNAGDLTSSLLLGSEIQIVPGWYTASSGGNEVASSGPYANYWIEKVRVIERHGRRFVEVEGGDIWSLLDSWVSRRQLQYSATAVDVIVAQLAGRAGVGFAPAGGASAALGTLAPPFVLPAGESAASGIRRLFRMVTDTPYQADQLLQCAVFASSDSSSLSLGGSGEQPIRSYERETNGIRPAFVRVVGVGGAVGQARDDAAIALIADPGVVVSDLALSSAANLADEASKRLRDAQLHGYSDSCEITMNPGLVYLDVVSVTASREGLTAQKRRILRSLSGYDRERKLQFDQTLELGAV